MVASEPRLPAEYRRISSRWAVTRGELAALLGVNLCALLEQPAREHIVILTDTRGHWADPWIHTAVRSGVLEASPTHRFEPDALVHRQDLAGAIAAVLELVAVRHPSRARRWRNLGPGFADMSPSHVRYHDARTAVSAGVLERRRDGWFLPRSTVRGVEAVDVVRRLVRLARG